MQTLKKSIYFLLFIFLMTKCSKDYEVPLELEIHDFVWKGLNAYYLYQDQVPDLSDKRFTSDEALNAYLATFTDYTLLFQSLLITDDSTSEIIEDFSDETNLSNTFFTNGIEYGIFTDPVKEGNVIGYVIVVLPNSDAATKSIVRGEFFYAVDGTVLTRDNYSDLLENGEDSFTLNFADFDGSSLTPNGKNILLSKTDYTYKSLISQDILNISGDNVGYMAFSKNLAEDLPEEINQTILSFSNSNVSKVILDFRYSLNEKTFTKTVNQFASMFVKQAEEQISIKEEWNTKAQDWFLENQPDSIISTFTNQIKPSLQLNRMHTTDIYMIMNGENFTGSASLELLINTLKPYTNVYVVGNQSEGKTKGIIRLYNSIDYNFKLRSTNHNVALEPIVLTFFNADDETFENGFTPDISLCSTENPTALGDLGSSTDATLNKIFNHIQFGTISDANCTTNFNVIFNSVNQKNKIEKGVYLNRLLPNTL